MTVRCDGCGVLHLRYRSQAEGAKRRYCTAECYRANRTGDKNPKWRGGMRVKNCDHCAGQFECIPCEGDREPRRFCSPQCRVEGMRVHASPAVAKRVHGRRAECRKRAGRADLPIHSEEEWAALLAKHGGRCAHCGTTERIERDHIIPLSKGGDDSIGNIQPLCVTCNRRKWNKT